MLPPLAYVMVTPVRFTYFMGVMSVVNCASALGACKASVGGGRSDYVAHGYEGTDNSCTGEEPTAVQKTTSNLRAAASCHTPA